MSISKINHIKNFIRFNQLAKTDRANLTIALIAIGAGLLITPELSVLLASVLAVGVLSNLLVKFSLASQLRKDIQLIKKSGEGISND